MHYHLLAILGIPGLVRCVALHLYVPTISAIPSAVPRSNVSRSSSASLGSFLPTGHQASAVPGSRSISPIGSPKDLRGSVSFDLVEAVGCLAPDEMHVAEDGSIDEIAPEEPQESDMQQFFDIHSLEIAEAGSVDLG